MENRREEYLRNKEYCEKTGLHGFDMRLPDSENTFCSSCGLAQTKNGESAVATFDVSAGRTVWFAFVRLSCGHDELAGRIRLGHGCRKCEAESR